MILPLSHSEQKRCAFSKTARNRADGVMVPRSGQSDGTRGVDFSDGGATRTGIFKDSAFTLQGGNRLRAGDTAGPRILRPVHGTPAVQRSHASSDGESASAMSYATKAAKAPAMTSSV